jgi:hypothetical protein
LNDRRDKNALSFDHVEIVSKHSSQVDYSKGFGGKFGVQNDRTDKSALAFNHTENTEKRFGGKFGIEKDKMDNRVLKFDNDDSQKVGTNYQPTKPIPKANLKSIKALFENSQINDKCTDIVRESQKRGEEVRLLRMQREHQQEYVSFDESIISKYDDAKTNTPKKDNATLFIETNKEPELIQETKNILENTEQSLVNDSTEYEDWDGNSNPVEIAPIYVEPKTYYEDIVPLQSSEMSEFSAIALYDYDANENDEITFKMNDVIRNIKKVI